jgi:hemerythrin-like domain-containing protein
VKRHEQLRPLSRGHQPILVHARDLRWRATYLERGDAHLGESAWPHFRSWARLALEPHLGAEEQHLLPRLSGHDDDVLTTALEEDRAARDALRAVVAALPDAEAPETLRTLADALERHARHCEHVLFPAAERVLGEDGLDGLAEAIGAYEI